MTNKIIIVDAGPLIAFGKIKHIDLLAKILGTLIAPEFVLNECLANPSQPGAKEIAAAIDEKLIIPHVNPNNKHYTHRH